MENHLQVNIVNGVFEDDLLNTYYVPGAVCVLYLHHLINFHDNIYS